MKRDGIFSWVKLDVLKAWLNTTIGVTNILRYDQYFTFNNPLDIPNKAYVDGIASQKTTITGDQDDVDLDNGYGKLTTTLTDDNIFVCTVTPAVGQEFKIPSTMLLGSVLFGFPNPTTTNFTFKITLI